MPEGFMTGVIVLVVLAVLGTVMGSLTRFGWLFELATHFRQQYAWVLLISAGALCVARRWPEAAFAAGLALINLSFIRPLYRKTEVSGNIPTPDRGPTYRTVLANVQFRNRSYDLVLRAIRQTQPDLLVLEEINARWLEALRPLGTTYPFSQSIVLQRGFGILVLSRMPFSHAEIIHPAPQGLPSLLMRVHLHEQEMMLIATHPHSPGTPAKLRRRNSHLAALAAILQKQSRPLMLIGDLNTTSWSPSFQDLLRATQLRDSRVGFGVQPTWPAFVPPLMIPLDHCLVSPEIVVVKRRVGPFIGSDHLPVIVDFTCSQSC